MATANERVIRVYADWSSPEPPRLMGNLTASRIRGHEVFAFEYDPEWIRRAEALYLDPHLGHYSGRQYVPEAKANFGIFLDSSPDRWGRLLMRRREAYRARQESREERTLLESDYLLGVFDGHRMGALRFKLDKDGEFLNNEKLLASPPWTSLRELEHASMQLEREDAILDPEYAGWLSLLVDPGSSLGGARPKASVLDEQGNLWIAKFPSSADAKNVGAWEMVLHQMAGQCGITVPESKLMRFSGRHHTYLSRRFDRTTDRHRIHFASAITLLGYNDGTDHADGVSYLELAAFIIQHGDRVKADLEQLWRRILFNILVSNTDDHLRNHGFLLTPTGWRLSPAYDMNPNEQGHGLTLNITDTGNELDISLALEVARHFKLKPPEANRILTEMTDNLKQWRALARKTGIGQGEIEQTRRAFRLTGQS